MRIIITEKKLAALGACNAARLEFSKRHKRLDISKINIYDPANRWLHDYYHWCTGLLTWEAGGEFSPLTYDAVTRFNSLLIFDKVIYEELYRDLQMVRLGILIEFVLKIAADPTQHHKLKRGLLPRTTRRHRDQDQDQA